MNRKSRIIQLLEREMPFLKSKYGVIKIGLFGSYSLGRESEGSDIDLLVQFEKTVAFLPSWN
jgi:hypothetical protein